MRLFLLLMLTALWACGADAPEQASPPAASAADPVEVVEKPAPAPSPAPDYDTTAWRDVQDLDPSIVLDLRYATTNNFVEEKMYECGRCFLRPEVAKALVRAHRDLRARGYGGLKMYDCYRPRPVQWALWRKVPDPNYVADPRKGSMHNRGSAADLTIVDRDGQELDMGTGYDYFGVEAHHDYTGHSEQIQAHRDLLKAVMDRQGFRSIRTEWWHYSYRPQSYAIADWVWSCD